MLMSMDRIFCLFVCLSLGLGLFSGCDRVRAVLGRPTSGEIAQMKEVMDADIARKQHVADSIAAVEAAAAKAIKDSTDALQAMTESGVMLMTPSSLGGMYKSNLDHRYYIVLGSYRMHYNVVALLGRIDPEYDPCSVYFCNGLEVVLAAPADRIADSWATFLKIREKDYCPSGAWILDNGE